MSMVKASFHGVFSGSHASEFLCSQVCFWAGAMNHAPPRGAIHTMLYVHNVPWNHTVTGGNFQIKNYSQKMLLVSIQLDAGKPTQNASLSY